MEKKAEYYDSYKTDYKICWEKIRLFIQINLYTSYKSSFSDHFLMLGAKMKRGQYQIGVNGHTSKNKYVCTRTANLILLLLYVQDQPSQSNGYDCGVFASQVHK